jgi:FKBP-type peptidyl-prolyl cis-trans isomerase
MKLALPTSLAAALVTLAACAPVAIENTPFAATLGVDLAASTKLPSGMYVRDLKLGLGEPPTTGQQVTMLYTGWLADATRFDLNQTSGFQFRLGLGEVIAGWDLGVAGMQVGGQRQLIIPPALGYGEAGQGPIPGNAVLVFDVTMLRAP